MSVRILRLEHRDKKNGVILKVQLGDSEFRQLQGSLNNICLVALDMINEPVRVTKTGARHSYAKWFLVPVKMRVQYKAEDFDYENAQLGCVEYRDKVLFVYVVGKKDFGVLK